MATKQQQTAEAALVPARSALVAKRLIAACEAVRSDRVVIWNHEGRAESVASVARVEAIYRAYDDEEILRGLIVTDVSVTQARASERHLAAMSDEEIEDRIAELEEAARAARSHGERDRRAETRLELLRKEKALRAASA